MALFTWLAGLFSIRDKASSLYESGLKKAKSQNHAGAIDDYTLAIDMPNASFQVKAMAQYNRALVQVAANNDTQAVEDLNVVLAMKETLTNVKSMARQQLLRIEGRSAKQRN